MKNLLFIMLLILVTACGKPQTPEIIIQPPTNVDSAAQAEIKSYIDAFESRNLLAGGNPNPTNLQVVLVSDLASNILGTCTMGAAYVKINQYLWDQLNPAHREELIFHELGHCVLGRLHNNALNGPYPASLMNSYHMGPSIYLRTPEVYRSYMAELFGTNTMTFANLNYSDSEYASVTYNYASVYLGEDQISDPTMEGMDEITCLH